MQTTQITEQNKAVEIIGLRRAGLAALFLAGGLAIFVLGSPYYQLFATNRNTLYNAILAVLFLCATLALYRSEGSRKYWKVGFAFFAAATANLALGLDLIRFPGASAGTAAGMTLDKLAQFIKIVVPLLILVKAAGEDLGSIYLRRGKLKTWLLAGLASLAGFVALGLALGAAQGKEMGAMLSTLPYG